MGGSAEEELQGTLLVVSGACIFALVAMVVKTDPLPLLLATELRFLVSWVVAIIFMLLFRKQRGLHWFGPPESRTWLLLKSVLSFAFILCWWSGLRYAPVGNCIAIIYCSPILTAILAKLMLNEDLGNLFFFQVLLVTAGSLLILEPPFMQGIFPWVAKGSNEGSYVSVIAALLFSAALPLVTKKTRDCSWIEVEHVSAFLACVLLDPALMIANQLLNHDNPVKYVDAGTKEALIIILAALGAFVGVALETKGYQLASVGRASMFRYVEVPFAYLLQMMFAREGVKPKAFLGACCIVTSCFLGLHEPAEAARDDASTQTVPSPEIQLSRPELLPRRRA